jgi:hypothetical protein
VFELFAPDPPDVDIHGGKQPKSQGVDSLIGATKLETSGVGGAVQGLFGGDDSRTLRMETPDVEGKRGGHEEL